MSCAALILRAASRRWASAKLHRSCVASGSSISRQSAMLDRSGEDELRAIASETIPTFSEEALALEYAKEHAPHLRYVADWGKWMIWDNSCWKQDNTLRALDLAALLHTLSPGTVNQGTIYREHCSCQNFWPGAALGLQHRAAVSALAPLHRDTAHTRLWVVAARPVSLVSFWPGTLGVLV